MKHLYVANWKMNMTYRKSIDFCIQNSEQLKILASNATIVLCPSFIALAPIVEIFKNTAIAIGAQNCSEYATGSHTGEVSAQSLAEVGVTYCFVGHQERRKYFGETTEIIIKKIDLLLTHNITPIICIGETQEHFDNKATFTVLTEQLKPIIENLNQSHKPIIIAYDPVWSIGTGIIPENSYLEEVFTWIIKLLQTHALHSSVQLFYGGSVNEQTIIQLKKVPHINGFLIGGASIDFARFKKIITTT
jgi:triosephosphate isomerase (TIM)